LLEQFEVPIQFALEVLVALFQLIQALANFLGIQRFEHFLHLFHQFFHLIGHHLIHELLQLPLFFQDALCLLTQLLLAQISLFVLLV